MIKLIESTATWVGDGTGQLHRLSLTRIWDKALPVILFIGLNPSRADESYNDPTITRCIDFAKSWGYGGLHFANLYSFQTPKVYGPMSLKEIAEGFSPLTENLFGAKRDETDYALQDMIKGSKTVVCCWGSWKFTHKRSREVLAMIKEPMCFGVNQDGSPKHPLYLPKTATLRKFIL